VTALTDLAVYYVAPVMAVLGWLAFGPRVDERTLLPTHH